MTDSSQSSSTTPIQAGSVTQLPERIPVWRLLVPLLFQTVIILAAPAQPFYTQLTGKTVVLQTVPVDPYDFLRGYSQTLSYDISRESNLKKLPGWKELVKQSTLQNSNTPSGSNVDYLPDGTQFYVVLEAPTSSASEPPKPWKPVKINSQRPDSLAANQIAIKGKFKASSIEYGLETYYMPEERRNEINDDISQARWSRKPQPVVVEVKIDSQGRAVPISFWVSDRNYRF